MHGSNPRSSACSHLTCQQANLRCHKGQKGRQLNTPLGHGNSRAHTLQRGPFPPPLYLAPKVLQETKDLVTRPCLLDVVLPMTSAGLLLLYVMLTATLSPSMHGLTEHARTMLLTNCKSGMLAPSLTGNSECIDGH